MVNILAMCEQLQVEKLDRKMDDVPPVLRIQHDGVDVVDSAPTAPSGGGERDPTTDSDIPPKKRKTRRGKSKRQRNVHPYRKNDMKLAKLKMNKAEAPYNSNRFLIEDHGDLESIDEELKKTDQASSSTVTRTRDSSVSMDSDGEFYSTPDDEEVFLIKDFDDQYESLQAERLQAMTKDELIKEYLMLEGKVEMLTKRLPGKPFLNGNGADNASANDSRAKCEVQREIQRLTNENESLRRENDNLRSKMDSSSDSADSETDSSDTCSSTTSSLSRSETPLVNNHSQPVNNHEETNGHHSADNAGNDELI